MGGAGGLDDNTAPTKVSSLPQQMKIDRGTFFHTVYRIQQKLGRVFRELKPYCLFPLDEYFAGRIDKTRVVMMPPARRQPVQPPLRKIA